MTRAKPQWAGWAAELAQGSANDQSIAASLRRAAHASDGDESLAAYLEAFFTEKGEGKPRGGEKRGLVTKTLAKRLPDLPDRLRIYEADMIAKPDPSTFQLLPWKGEAPGVGRMFCDILMPDGSPSYADPRWVLKRALGRASDLGFTFYTHPEVEFFLLKEKPRPGQRPEPIDSGGYFDHTPHSIAHDFRKTSIMMLESMGLSVEYSHHEDGPGQQEIDLLYADALTTADNIMSFRLVMKEDAIEQGVYATFMPKPFTD